jgi:hypothetical protein
VNTARRRSWRTLEAVASLILALATAAFTLWQNAHVAVLWDLTYLLDTSFRITLHQFPYRDFPFAHAPLTFLIQAAIIRLTGRVYWHQVFYAALAGAAATLLTWRILLRLLTVNDLTGLEEKTAADERFVVPAQPESPYLSFSSATIALLLALPLTVLGIYSIYPHPEYDPDCILAVLLALFLLQRASDSIPRNAIAGAACVLPLFFKQNIGLPFLLVTIACIAAIAIARRLQSVPIAPQISILAGTFTALAAAIVTLHLTVGLHNYLYWTVTFAGQRRLPSLSLILDIYHQTSLLWTVPAAIAALFLLRLHTPGAPSMARFLGDMSGNHRRVIALTLLSAPFLWTIASLFLTDDPSDRAGQLLSLWPHLLLLSIALAVYNLLRIPTFETLLPFILIATIHGTFLSQRIWGSTYAIWPSLMLLIAALLTQVPAIARPLAAIISATFLLCGGLYAVSHERLSYNHFEGPLTHATIPALKGLATPGPWIPDFEELVRFTNAEIPMDDGILLIPGQNPFYYATGRTPRFPIHLFDPATNPYSPQQIVEQVRARNIRWLIVNRDLQLTADPVPNLPEYLQALLPEFVLYRTLANFEIYRRK